MELSSNFSGPSVLQYDDEFRHIQAVYNYLWSFYSHHLHTVIQYAVGKSTLGSALANFSPDGRVICRNFNRVKGCSLADCHFAHVCNRQVNGRACGLAHPLHSHPGIRGRVQGQGGPATSSWLPLASPLNTDLWLTELIGDEDEAFLTDGILHGFKLALAHCTFLPAQQNYYKSATSAAHKPKVEQTILGQNCR